MAGDNPWTKPPYYPPVESAAGREVRNPTTSEREPRHISVRAGDKIWVNRRLLRLSPDTELSDEYLEVIDVVERS